MAMGHHAQHAIIFIVVRQIVARHQHGYGNGVGDGNGDRYSDAKRRQRQRYNNQPQDRGGGTVVGAVATTTKTVGMAPSPTMDCGATLADDGYDGGGSQDCGEARTTDVDDDPGGGCRQP